MGRVERIIEYGAYISLIDYPEINGFIHISEVSPTYIRSVREKLSEGQISAFRVVKIDKARNFVDLSLKRLSDREKEEFEDAWKRRRKAMSLLREVARTLNVDEDDFVNRWMKALESKFRDAYTGLERIAAGTRVKLAFPEEWITAVREAAIRRIGRKEYRRRAFIQVFAPGRKGVFRIREVLEPMRSRTVRLRVYLDSPPRYVIEVVGDRPDDVSRALRRFLRTVGERARNLKVEFHVVKETK